MLFPRLFTAACALTVPVSFPAVVRAGESESTTAAFVAEVNAFVGREIAAHVAAIERTDPPQERVLGVPATGAFTWGSFMRALTSCTALTGEQIVAGRDVPLFLGQLGLIEARQGGKTFAQLGAALALRQFGADLEQNPLWQSLTPGERAEWRSLLDPGRFYDRHARRVIDLPENYLGVAARIGALDWELGLERDRAFVDDLLERAAHPFLEGARYADDAVPDGRYDRYAQEYARFIHEAARILGRRDIQEAVAPALRAGMRTWWDLVGPDGYGYPWGRTIGAISYQDTLEIIGFVAANPEFRPAPLPELASVYQAAWRWLQQDYQPDHHLLNMFGYGRGNYNYMSPERQWQQTTAFLFKAADSFRLLSAALAAERVERFPAAVTLPAVARFEWFRQAERPAGVWLVREGDLRFALPFTTGPEAGITDYLPVPHGLPGFAVPVQQHLPALVPHLTLPDGRTIVASDCADEIIPQSDGRGVRARWSRWVVSGAKAAELIEPGIVADVTWAIEDGALVRREIFTASRAIELRRFEVSCPMRGDRVTSRSDGARLVHRFEGGEAALEVVVEATGIVLKTQLQATGASAAGKGARGAIPLILHYGAADVRLEPGQPVGWSWRIRVNPE